LPGRRGEPESNPDLVFVPVKFAEYAESTDQHIAETIRSLDLLRTEKRHKEIISLSQGMISPQIEKLGYEIARTNLLLDRYLMTGGIPRAINELLKSGKISELTYRTYVDVVKGDLTRYGMNENYLRQILEQLFKTIGTPVGWSTLRKGTDVASSNTIESYVVALDSSFVLNFFYRMNALERKPEYAKEKKVIFADPFFFHALGPI
jgi:predicted AAA+ superfamily ATPase